MVEASISLSDLTTGGPRQHCRAVCSLAHDEEFSTCGTFALGAEGSPNLKGKFRGQRTGVSVLSTRAASTLHVRRTFRDHSITMTRCLGGGASGGRLERKD